MREQRRHQRIRFSPQLNVRLARFGCVGVGELGNLSPGGGMFRTLLPVKVGELFGCEFSVFGSPLIDIAAQAVNRMGDLLSARF